MKEVDSPDMKNKNAFVWNPSKKDRLIMLALILALGGVIIRPVVAKNLYFQGVYLENMNMNELAQKKYEKSLLFNPRLQESLYALAMAYEQTSKEPKSVSYCMRILVTDREYTPCYDLLARVHLRQRNFKALALLVQPVLNLDLTATDVPTLKILATAYEKTGDIKKARYVWTKVLSLQPNDGMAKAKLNDAK